MKFHYFRKVSNSLLGSQKKKSLEVPSRLSELFQRSNEREFVLKSLKFFVMQKLIILRILKVNVWRSNIFSQIPTLLDANDYNSNLLLTDESNSPIVRNINCKIEQEITPPIKTSNIAIESQKCLIPWNSNSMVYPKFINPTFPSDQSLIL